jgi:hypothetical protein
VLQDLGGWKSESMVRRYAHMSVKHPGLWAVSASMILRPKAE